MDNFSKIGIVGAGRAADAALILCITIACALACSSSSTGSFIVGNKDINPDGLVIFSLRFSNSVDVIS